jgi:tRNA(Arg) A34 adenosine deaminase TadA
MHIKKKLTSDYIFDQLYKLSLRAYKENEVPVSSLIVDPVLNKILSKSYNQNRKKNNPCAHAEIESILKACKILKKPRLDGLDLYTSLEPCLMCSSVIFQTKLKRVYFCIEDKKNGALINNYKLSFKTHLNHKLEVYYGFHQDRFSKILKKFFKLKR